MKYSLQVFLVGFSSFLSFTVWRNPTILVQDYESLYADVGSNGRGNDSGVWNKSYLQAIQNGSVKLPKDDALVNGVIAPYVFVCDDAFALKKIMLKPYPQQKWTAEKRVYNYRHSRVRRIPEYLFGILANRWRIFSTTINLEPKHVENIALFALALHNMLIKTQLIAQVIWQILSPWRWWSIRMGMAW